MNLKLSPLEVDRLRKNPPFSFAFCFRFDLATSHVTIATVRLVFINDFKFKSSKFVLLEILLCDLYGSTNATIFRMCIFWSGHRSTTVVTKIQLNNCVFKLTAKIQGSTVVDFSPPINHDSLNSMELSNKSNEGPSQ